MPYFPLIHAPVHYSHGRRSAPLISRLRAEAASPPHPLSPPSGSPSVLFAIPHGRDVLPALSYNLRCISAALYLPPSCLPRLRGPLPSLSASSSSRASFRTSAAINSLSLFAFVSPNVLFLFQLRILPSFALRYHCFAFPQFRLSSFLFNLSRFVFSKGPPVTISTFFSFNRHARLCRFVFLTSAFYVYRSPFLNLRWTALWPRRLICIIVFIWICDEPHDSLIRLEYCLFIR